MNPNEVRDELLNEKLSERDVDRARRFLAGCATSTLALRALMAVMCELDQIREAEQLELVIPAIASIEASTLSEEEVAT